MATHEHDEFERTAGYYNDRLPIELRKLHDVLEPLLDSATPLTYSQYLHLKQAFELVEQTMHRRDMFGTHSDTGRLLFRHLAHPEQYPAPEETTLV